MGQEMFGPYRLDGVLGRGGMGEVHRAYDTRRDRPVALKLLLEPLSADDEFRSRFRREAAVAAQLNDPHVIPIHDFGEIDGRLFLDMRLVEGSDLSSIIYGSGPLPPNRAVSIIEQIASALDAAHDAGLIHRDIKPSNVLIVERPAADFCYLVDFGIARSASTSSRSRMTASGTTIGTFAYMAPERFSSGTIDHTVDIYALACVLYETLAGEQPFPSDEPAILLNAHLNLPPPNMSEVRPSLSCSLDEIVKRGMAKNPRDRYRTAGELAEAARSAITSNSSSPPNITQTTPVPQQEEIREFEPDQLVPDSRERLEVTSPMFDDLNECPLETSYASTILNSSDAGFDETRQISDQTPPRSQADKQAYIGDWICQLLQWFALASSLILLADSEDRGVAPAVAILISLAAIGLRFTIGRRNYSRQFWISPGLAVLSAVFMSAHADPSIDVTPYLIPHALSVFAYLISLARKERLLYWADTLSVLGNTLMTVNLCYGFADFSASSITSSLVRAPERSAGGAVACGFVVG